MDTDDDMEIEEIQREEQWEMVQAELQLLYDLSSPAARKEYLRKQPWFHDLTSGEKEEYLSVIEKISHADAHANAVADTNADADVNTDADDAAAETGCMPNELDLNEDATNTSSSASPDKIYAVKTNNASRNAFFLINSLLTDDDINADHGNYTGHHYLSKKNIQLRPSVMLSVR